MKNEPAGTGNGGALHGSSPAGIESAGRHRLMVNPKAERGVVQVEQNAAALFGDHAHRLVKNLAAVAVGGKQIARRATGVNAHQHSLLTGRPRFRFAGGRESQRVRQARRAGASRKSGAVDAQVAPNQRNVAFVAVDLALVGDHAELAIASLDAAIGNAHNRAFVAQPVADHLRHGQDAQPVLLAKGNQVRDAGHLAVVAHDLADHAGGIQTGHASQIDRCLGLPGADQHAALTRAQRKDVPWTGQIGRIRAWIDRRADGLRPVRS